MSEQQHISNESAIFSLWLNWAIAVGMLAMPEFIGLFIPKTWLPLVTLGLMVLLLIYRISGKKYEAMSCDLVQSICLRALGYSAIIMLVIAIAYARGFVSIFYTEDVINLHIPYLTILILGPVASVLCGVAILKGDSSEVCRMCIIRYGNSSERGFLGKIFRQESNFQVRLLLILSVALSVLSWSYYALFYVNVNINGTDAFIYNWVPVIFYALSIVYLGLRYFSLWGYYYNHMEMNPRGSEPGSTMRYIIICGDNVFLTRNEGFYDVPDNNRFDTPASLRVSFADAVSKERAREVFGSISGISESDYDMRFMYKSSDVSGNNNIYHFICCLENRDVIRSSRYEGKWCSLSQLQRLLYNRELAPMLATEIHRLYTITMAWKTYDCEGRRLYKIKNYRPNFRLNGICEWDVDFNNSRWLEVARLNEDKPFYRFRKLFQRRQKQSEGYNA